MLRSAYNKTSPNTVAADDIVDEDAHGDIAFSGFANATPQQLLKLRLKHAGATSNMAAGYGDGTEDDGEYEHDMEAARQAKEELYKMLGALMKTTAASFEDLSNAHFLNCLKHASRNLVTRWNEAEQSVEHAMHAAQQNRSADNFVAFERARLDRKIVATEIVMAQASRDGRTEDYNAAKTANEQFVQLGEHMDEMSARMGALSEQEKIEFLETAFPDQWNDYKNGKLAIDRHGPGNCGAIRQAASTGGIDQPFLQTLKDLFTAAGRYLAGSPDSTPAGQTQAVRSQPQPG